MRQATRSLLSELTSRSKAGKEDVLDSRPAMPYQEITKENQPREIYKDNKPRAPRDSPRESREQPIPRR